MVFTSSDVCQCCKCTPMVLACRNRGGLLQLCGFSEFTNPSTPPRIYKKLATTGTMTIKSYSDAACTEDPGVSSSPIVYGPHSADGSGVFFYDGDIQFTLVQGVGGATFTLTGGAWHGNVAGVLTGGYYAISLASIIGGTGPTVNIGVPVFLPSGTYGVIVHFSESGLRDGFFSPNIPNLVVGRTALRSTVDTWNQSQIAAVPDCSITTTNTSTRTIAGVPAAFPSGFPEDLYAGMATITETATQRLITGNGACIPDLANPGEYISCTGTVRIDLSQEDTEEDAIARFQAATAWSDWKFPGDLLSCPGFECCMAKWQLRETGSTFVYQESQLKVTGGGYPPSTTYPVRVAIRRRPFGSGTFAKYQTLTFSATSDGAGMLDVTEQDTPNERGFETYASAACSVDP